MPRGRAPGYDTQREQILARAAELFARQGYSGTSMNQVAAACGVSKASLYHYVHDKYRLLVEIAEGHVDRLRALVADEAAPKTDETQQRPPEARLRELIVRFMGAYADAQAQHRVLTEDVKFLEPDDRRRILDGERAVVDAFARAIAAARPDLGAARLEKPLTMLLFGMMNWMFTWLRPEGPLSHAQLTPVVADLFFGGLVAVQAPAPAPPAAPGRSRTRTSRAAARVAA
ncbi:MAG: TetR/AcrR family transcriptional regulator [Pseudomonadota bacterium]|nr:TetR/AcrR family transcriptional regulator [Pseudomonadota bacterium]